MHASLTSRKTFLALTLSVHLPSFYLFFFFTNPLQILNCVSFWLQCCCLCWPKEYAMGHSGRRYNPLMLVSILNFPSEYQSAPKHVRLCIPLANQACVCDFIIPPPPLLQFGQKWLLLERFCVDNVRDISVRCGITIKSNCSSTRMFVIDRFGLVYVRCWLFCVHRAVILLLLRI